jgi:hypothetical protein
VVASYDLVKDITKLAPHEGVQNADISLDSSLLLLFLFLLILLLHHGGEG